MRDAIIKSFMIVFTNESNRHLLLNTDLIDMANNCIEFGSQIKTEAQLKTARLLSLQLQFQRVQNRMVLTNQARSVIGMYQLIEFLCQIDDQLR